MSPILKTVVIFLLGTIYSEANIVSHEDIKMSLSQHPIILVVSFDGFGANYFESAATPTLDSLRGSGVRVPYMEPAFPTNTYPNHQTIVTGLYPESHGIVDNELFDPELNKTLSGFKDDPEFWNYREDVLPIWLRNEMAGEGRTSGCMMWPGSFVPYGPSNNSFPTYYSPIYNDSIPWEERVDKVISWITDPSKPANLVFLYHESPDYHGHGYGPNAPETIEEIERTDNRTGYLIEKLKDKGIFGMVNLILLSDHGCKELTPKNIFNISQLLQDHSHTIERSFVHSPVSQFSAKEGKVEELYEALKGNNGGRNNYTIWRKSEMRQPFYYTNSRRVMDLVMVADPGFAFQDFYESIVKMNVKFNLTANDSREYGAHGYSNVYAPMRPFFLAHGPAFRRDLDHGPIKNVDIFPLISTILKIPEVPNNGSLERVIRMIHPSYLSPTDGGNMVHYSLNYFVPFVGIILYHLIC